MVVSMSILSVAFANTIIAPAHPLLALPTVLPIAYRCLLLGALSSLLPLLYGERPKGRNSFTAGCLGAARGRQPGGKELG